MQPTVTSPPSKKKGKYDITFKLKVIQWAEKHSNRAAGSKFGLNESTIRGWRKSAVANSLEALSEISRGVISIHSVQQPQSQQQQQHHQPTPAITKSAPKQIQTSESKLSANQNHIHHNNNNNNIINGGNGNVNGNVNVGNGNGNRSHPYHHINHHHHMNGRHSILSKGASRPSSRPVSPPETLTLDERDLARLSCSPSDDSHYDEGSYQEEVVESPPPSPPLVSQPAQHHSYQQREHSQATNHHQQQQQQYQMQQLHTQQAHQHLHVPQQHQQSHSQQNSQVLKTISHQVTSRPYPEIQLPFTVIVCKSVRDHWLQRYAVEKPESEAEVDSFARVLGLERR